MKYCVKQLIKITLLFCILSPSAIADDFKTLYFNHQENASDKWMNYLDIYEDNFNKFINKKPQILEIGVQNGGDLQVFSKFFQNADIFGIDINPTVCKQDLGKNISVFCFDIKNTKSYIKNLGQNNYDIIIDDGSHLQSDIIFAFEFLFEKLNPGGIFLVEDLHTSYWNSHEGGLHKTTSAMEYFKNLTDYLNHFHIDQKQTKTLSADFLKRYSSWIESITFYDGVIVIKKLNKKKSQQIGRIVTGRKQPVVPAIDIAKKHGYYIDQIDTTK